MNNRYIYFVSFYLPEGMGNIDIGINSLITSIEDIRSIEKSIKVTHNLEHVIIVHYQLLRENE